jgi:ATP-dependent DNA helicase RecG
VPNATVIIIEGAERFGLAQLHQFRGRVGRGADQSYCYLCPAIFNATIEKRLGILVESNNGFHIAEMDLELRGPGELLGKVQSGLPEFKIASLSNTNYLLEIKELVEEFDRKNPGKLLSYTDKIYSTNYGSLE